MYINMFVITLKKDLQFVKNQRINGSIVITHRYIESEQCYNTECKKVPILLENVSEFYCYNTEQSNYAKLLQDGVLHNCNS